MICDKCGAIFKRISNGETKGTFERYTGNVREESERGCYMCWFLWRNLTKCRSSSGTSEASAVIIFYEIRRDRESRHIKLLMGFEPRVFLMTLCLINHSKISKQLSNYTGDLAALDQARLWLSSCLCFHKTCKTPERATFLPPRLLDLRGDTIRLTSTIPSTSFLEYATLSHCWGPNPKTLKLSGSNLDQFVTEIPKDDIPKTFLDAVIACRHLHIQFLWIDSLCIIQDDKEDWNDHVKLMHSIYEYAQMNLAASDSSHPDAGLFRKRLAQNVETPIVTIDSGLFEGRFAIVSSFDEERIYPSEPLSQRGWVLQEEILSRRILHFRRDQLTWSCCASEYLSEMYPNGTGIHPWSILQKLKADSNQLPSLEDFESYVGAYSQRTLTFPDTDKFAAFAAVARYFTEARRDEYLAGFLSSTLPQSLLWYWKRNPVNTSPSAIFRAPTWSWASGDEVDTSWFRYYHAKQCYAAVVNKTVHLLDPTNPFGPITHATITIRAPLVTLKIRVDRKNNPLGLGTVISTVWTQDQVRLKLKYDRKFDIEGKDQLLKGLVMELYTPKKHGRVLCSFSMLLIRPTDSGLFERIGICEAIADWPTVELAQEACDSLEKEEITLI